MQEKWGRSVNFVKPTDPRRFPAARLSYENSIPQRRDGGEGTRGEGPRWERNPDWVFWIYLDIMRR